MFAADPVDPYADARLVAGEPPLPEKGAFTVAVLPDTQNYSEKFPEQYLAQTRWIVESRRDRNIAACCTWATSPTAARPPNGRMPSRR